MQSSFFSFFTPALDTCSLILVSVTLVQISSKPDFFRITVLPDSPDTEKQQAKSKSSLFKQGNEVQVGI